MSNNDKLQEHTDPTTGKQYVTTTDASGKYALVVDAENAHLLCDTTWTVEPVHCNSTKLRARAITRAPGIKIGRSLHRLALGTRSKQRGVRALDGNLLNATKANLQVVSRSDLAILNRSTPANKVVGVRRSTAPRWLKTDKEFRATISVDGKSLHLGNWKTLAEAACAFDGAARRLYGANAVTNRSLRLIPEKVARTAGCRKAARAAKRKVEEYKDKVRLEKYAAFKVNPSRENFIAFATPRPTQPRVVITSFADAESVERASVAVV